MRLKSFFAETIEVALSQARREMGEEAILVSSRRTGPEAQHLGEYEVVCAGEQSPERQHREPAPVSPPAKSQPIDRLSREVADLKQQMERLASNLARSSSSMSAIASNPELSRAFAMLTDAEIEPELAYDIVFRAGPPVSPDSLRSELARSFTTGCGLTRKAEGPHAIALVGPPGSGKTTCLVKLAARYGLALRKPSVVISLDTHRIAAADQLRTLTSILGIGFLVLDTPAALAQALEEHRQKQLILIDTPGLSRAEMEEAGDLARVLSNAPGIETHLVVPAVMRGMDIKRIVAQFEAFQPRHLLFTRVDETETFGPIVNESFRTGKPVSFLSNGQQIPEDLQAATEGRIADLVLQAALSPERKPGAMAAA